eukprot:3236535-Pyramimonas_sp.AAC.1
MDEQARMKRRWVISASTNEEVKDQCNINWCCGGAYTHTLFDPRVESAPLPVEARRAARSLN